VTSEAHEPGQGAWEKIRKTFPEREGEIVEISTSLWFPKTCVRKPGSGIPPLERTRSAGLEPAALRFVAGTVGNLRTAAEIINRHLLA
jgi:hypothetical protein